MLPDWNRSRAVVFGMSSGGGRVGLADLPSVKNNLSELRRVLTDGTVWALPGSHVLYRPEPTSAVDFLRELDRVATDEKATDTLLVYYAGHGVRLGEDGRLYLAIPGMWNHDEGIEYEKIRARIGGSASRARKVVVILDCCYSGLAIRGDMGRDSELAEDSVVDGACVLTASASNRKARAPVGDEYTVFTGALLGALGEGRVDAPKFLTASDVHAEVESRIRAIRADSSPRDIKPPLPLIGRRGGDIVLCANRSFVAESDDSTKDRIEEVRTALKGLVGAYPDVIAAVVRALRDLRPDDGIRHAEVYSVSYGKVSRANISFHFTRRTAIRGLLVITSHRILFCELGGGALVACRRADVPSAGLVYLDRGAGNADIHFRQRPESFPSHLFTVTEGQCEKLAEFWPDLHPWSTRADWDVGPLPQYS